MTPVGMSGGRTASTRVTARQAPAWNCDTQATARGAAPLAARLSAAAIPASGGRWSVCTTGAPSPVASSTAGTSNAWLCTTSYRAWRTAA